MDPVAVRGILFDSGGTLVRPIGGRWNPRFDFEEVVARHVPGVPMERFSEACAAGDRFLCDSASTVPRDEYHRVILGVLGIEPARALLDDLNRPLAVPAVEPYPEATAVLEGLRRRGIPLAIVSDNWPGLAGTYRQLGLAHHFELFVVSAEMGCRKPDPRMYRAGSDGLGLAPADCLFVDDDPELVAAAVRLGYAGVVIVRDGSERPPDLPRIADLGELFALLESG